MSRAACHSADPELFFPLGSTGPGSSDTMRAKAICRRCPVIDRCLDWALSQDAQHGIWGGLSEHERLLVRRQQQQRERSARVA